MKGADMCNLKKACEYIHQLDTFTWLVYGIYDTSIAIIVGFEVFQNKILGRKYQQWQ